MKYEGLIGYAKEHTISECAEHYNCCYKCMNSYLYKHKIPYKKTVRKMKGTNIRHGDSHTRLHQIWSAMRYRCNNRTNKHYGAKGIRVCEEWNDYIKFRQWALSNGYADHLTIDRIDGNKGYFPDNCRWVDYKVQANNQSRNKLVTYKGVTKTISQWAEYMNVPKQTLYARLKRGWDIERALSLGGK